MPSFVRSRSYLRCHKACKIADAFQVPNCVQSNGFPVAHHLEKRLNLVLFKRIIGQLSTCIPVSRVRLPGETLPNPFLLHPRFL
jgi:hypothetical protein